MEIALNSDLPGGFKHKNAIASQNGLALLASITLKNALNIKNNNNNSTCENKNNTNNNNYLTFNHNHINKNNIKKYKTAPHLQHGLTSSSTLSSTTGTSSSPSKIQEHKNILTFTTVDLQVSTATTESAIKTETGAPVGYQQQQTLSTIALENVEALSSKANNQQSTLSSNRHQTNNSNNNSNHNNTSSAKDPTIALLEALSIKTNKKQQQKQQQISASTSTLTTSTATTTTTSHSAVGNVSNTNTTANNIGNNNGNGNGNNKNNFKIPSDILDDLASRFIINVPDMELNNLIRICFQIELAHWFYLDFFCSSEQDKKLQPCGIKQFALQLFQHIPFLRHHLSSIDKILEDWKNYKLSVPTYGAILISEDLNFCLLVQSYFAKSSWGFPKGKVNENEDPVHCATREVYEETGYDITELIVPNDYIEAVINYQYTRLYIVRDVSLETKFSPRTRNEIKCCDWFPIDSLPINKTDAISKPKLGINANSFFMIMPFVKRLKKWVNDKRNGVETRRKYSVDESPTFTSPLTICGANVITKSSSKKQQKRNNTNNFNDDINAFNNGGGGGAAGTGIVATALTSSSCANNANANVNGSNSNSNSNRSKRQRHKSMGDLDGIKLNNFYNSNNQSNCKTTNNCGSTLSSCSTTTTTTTTTANSSGNNCNSNNKQKRHSKIVAAGSNISNNIDNNNANNNNSVVNNGNNTTSSKRQLFHSQSQTNNLQQNDEQKVLCSFNLLRKEKSQLKDAQAKTKKQQQNTNNSVRQRAKSQSDKMCMQQQQQCQQKPNSNSNNNNINKQQQRVQKQQSLIVTNSNMQNFNMNNNNNKYNNITKLNVKNNSFNNNNMTTGGYKTPTSPSLIGNDVLALVSAAAAAETSVDNNTTIITTSAGKTETTEAKNIIKVLKSGGGQQQKPRPSSVSLHFPEVSSIKRESSTELLAGQGQKQMPQLQRMASGTNLRILKRSTSHQPTQHNQEPSQIQASALQFTPSFNSWTNFTFTKNFIANVFC